MSRTKGVPRGGMRIDGATRKGMEIFTQMPSMDIPGSWCNLSHPHSTSFDMNYMIPILCEEVVPGDRFNFSVEGLLRMAPMLAPVMANIDIKYYWFFVAERTLWANQDDWAAHIMGASGDETLPADPGWNYFTLVDGAVPSGTIGNYMGLNPPVADVEIQVKCAPIAGFLKVYDDYFRSEQLQPELFTPLVPGEQTIYAAVADFTPPKISWMHDYFTSALPTPQVGLPVLIPLTNGTNSSIVFNPNASAFNFGVITDSNGTSIPGADIPLISDSGAFRADTAGGDVDAFYDPKGSLFVDDANLNSNAATIPDLRLAFRMQSYFEQQMRNGSRLNEWLWSMFNVMSSDARLQRAEYLSMSTHKMAISQVLATANTLVDTAETAVGQMAGHGISYGGGRRDEFVAEEHGYLYCICTVMPETKYGQGISRMWTRENYLDYLIPMFSNVNEQEIKRKEIHAGLTQAQLEETFGYIPRYSEYKFRNGRFSGDFQTDLDYWHLGRILAPEDIPYLTGAFIAGDASTRIFAVEEGQHILAEFYFNISARRPVAKFGVPTLM
ncbi:MAG: major capsid protein [Microviridae sp.]|nr:MAG: major capsid protein [Microviridae sp.]